MLLYMYMYTPIHVVVPLEWAYYSTNYSHRGQATVPRHLYQEFRLPRPSTYSKVDSHANLRTATLLSGESYRSELRRTLSFSSRTNGLSFHPSYIQITSIEVHQYILVTTRYMHHILTQLTYLSSNFQGCALLGIARVQVYCPIPSNWNQNVSMTFRRRGSYRTYVQSFLGYNRKYGTMVRASSCSWTQRNSLRLSWQNVRYLKPCDIFNPRRACAERDTELSCVSLAFCLSVHRYYTLP